MVNENSGLRTLFANRAAVRSMADGAYSAMAKLLLFAKFPQAISLSFEEVSKALDELVDFGLAVDALLEAEMSYRKTIETKQE